MVEAPHTVKSYEEELKNLNSNRYSTEFIDGCGVFFIASRISSDSSVNIRDIYILYIIKKITCIIKNKLQTLYHHLG